MNDAADNEFRTYSTANFKWQPKWGLSVETDLTYTGNAGLSDGFNVNYTVWNAGIGYRFLDSKRLEAKLWVFDILGQNTSINPVSHRPIPKIVGSWSFPIPDDRLPGS